MNEMPTTEGDWLIGEENDVAESPQPIPIENRKWRVLIVDDEADVHAVTLLALRDVKFKGRALELFSAYSAEEGFHILSSTDDVALVLLDVVMETDDAGLVLARRIREELNNQLVRVVLRTGQPGQAPEHSVIVEYDINDYKDKTDLVAQKMFTTVVAALRSYDSLLMLQRNRIGLGAILAGTNNLYRAQSLREFACGVLNQISAILNVGADGVLCVMQAGAAEPTVVAATGIYAYLADGGVIPRDHPLLPTIQKTLLGKHSQFAHPIDVLFVQTQVSWELAIAITPPWPLATMQCELLELFGLRIGTAFENLLFYERLHDAHAATVTALADLAEYRGSGNGGHVRRCQKLATRVAQTMKSRGVDDIELSTQFIEAIGLASLLHDVGMVATPDQIRLKPDAFTLEERRIMQAHSENGRLVLGRAARNGNGDSYLTIGAQAAGAHHEHFDGNGYPDGLSGRSIPLAARIVAVVDVYDALLHRRLYREAWADSDAMTYISERRGTQFDPDVVDALFELIDADPQIATSEEP